MLVSFFNLWFYDLPAYKIKNWNITISHRPHSLFMQTIWSGLHYQFLCHVLKALFFIKIALNLSYFSKKYAKFSSAGGSAPRPQNTAPIANFWLHTWQLYIADNHMRVCSFCFDTIFPWSYCCKPYDVNYVCLMLNCFLFEKFYLHYAVRDFDSIFWHSTKLFICQSIDANKFWCHF